MGLDAVGGGGAAIELGGTVRDTVGDAVAAAIEEGRGGAIGAVGSSVGVNRDAGVLGNLAVRSHDGDNRKGYQELWV